MRLLETVGLICVGAILAALVPILRGRRASTAMTGGRFSRLRKAVTRRLTTRGKRDERFDGTVLAPRPRQRWPFREVPKGDERFDGTVLASPETRNEEWFASSDLPVGRELSAESVKPSRSDESAVGRRTSVFSVSPRDFPPDDGPLILGLQRNVALVDAEGVVLAHRLGPGAARLGTVELGSSAVPVTRLTQTLEVAGEVFDLHRLVADTPVALISPHWTKSPWVATAGNEFVSAMSGGVHAGLRAAALVKVFAGVGDRSAVWALEAVGDHDDDSLDAVIGLAKCKHGLRIVGALRCASALARVRIGNIDTDESESSELGMILEYSNIYSFSVDVGAATGYAIAVQAASQSGKRVSGQVLFFTNASPAATPSMTKSVTSTQLQGEKP